MANRPLTRAEWMAALAEAVDNFDWSGAGERKWQGLTEKEAMEAVRVFRQENEGGFLVDFARAIEAKLKEKNT